MESSIDVLVPSANAVVGEWYSRTPAALDGMPPHITLLWPWLDAPVADCGIDRARRALIGVEPFVLTLRACARFPGVVYLAPEPRAAIDVLIARLVQAFPETPPFGGAFGSTPVPHLTAAKSANETELDAIQQKIDAALGQPLVVTVDRVSITEEVLGSDGRWAVRAELSLGT